MRAASWAWAWCGSTAMSEGSSRSDVWEFGWCCVCWGEVCWCSRGVVLVSAVDRLLGEEARVDSDDGLCSCCCFCRCCWSCCNCFNKRPGALSTFGAPMSLRSDRNKRGLDDGWCWKKMLWSGGSATGNVFVSIVCMYGGGNVVQHLICTRADSVPRQINRRR